MDRHAGGGAEGACGSAPPTAARRLSRPRLRRAAGARERRVDLPASENYLGGATLSRDGRWLAYEKGRYVATGTQAPSDYRVFVRGFEPPTGPVHVSSEEGMDPIWARDGRTLYYTRTHRDGTRNTMMAVAMADGRPVPRTPQRELFRDRWFNTFQFRGYDLDPGGTRFLFVEDEEPPPPQIVSRINVIVNWIEELKARVRPAK